MRDAQLIASDLGCTTSGCRERPDVTLGCVPSYEPRRLSRSDLRLLAGQQEMATALGSGPFTQSDVSRIGPLAATREAPGPAES